jgi:hypothetical protein
MIFRSLWPRRAPVNPLPAPCARTRYLDRSSKTIPSLRISNHILNITSIHLRLRTFTECSHKVCAKNPGDRDPRCTGCAAHDVLKLIIGEGLRLTLARYQIGIAGSLALARFLSSMLYGVTPTNPLTVAAVSSYSCWWRCSPVYLPARRAVGLNPPDGYALRIERARPVPRPA